MGALLRTDSGTKKRNQRKLATELRSKDFKNVSAMEGNTSSRWEEHKCRTGSGNQTGTRTIGLRSKRKVKEMQQGKKGRRGGNGKMGKQKWQLCVLTWRQAMEASDQNHVRNSRPSDWLGNVRPGQHLSFLSFLIFRTTRFRPFFQLFREIATCRIMPTRNKSSMTQRNMCWSWDWQDLNSTFIFQCK